MGSNLLAHLMDVSIRSGLLAVAATAAIRALRIQRSAAPAHAVWTLVLCAMLLLVTVGPVLPQLPLRILRGAPPQTALPVKASPASELVLPSAPATASRGTPALRTSPPPAPARRWPAWQEIVIVIYLSVSIALFARLFAGCLLVRRLLAASSIVQDRKAAGLAARLAACRRPILYESPSVAIPLTVGWMKPKILLPSGWHAWNNAKLEAVLAHEGAHLRRRDSLVAFAARANRCLFWFHPLAWWIERKLALLAEQACDDSSLAVVEDRQEYARLLLDMAGAVEATGGRASSHALAMARPSHIWQRIEAVLDETVERHAA